MQVLRMADRKPLCYHCMRLTMSTGAARTNELASKGSCRTTFDHVSRSGRGTLRIIFGGLFSWCQHYPEAPDPHHLDGSSSCDAAVASLLEEDLNPGQEKDEDWTPLSEQSEDDMCSRDETIESELPLQDEEKYVVFESCLLEIVAICRTCLMKCEPSLTVKGTLVNVETICKDAHYHTWSNQPVIKGKAAGSLLLSSAIFFSGASPTATLRVLQLMNVQVMTLRMYFNYQLAFLIPTVEKVWTEHQDELLEQLNDSPVDLSGDGRCDSPGFPAKYLTYSVYAPQINKILHCEQVQVGECEEVRASVQMEKQGFIRSLKFLKTKDIKVRSLTTDRHRSIAKHMREVEPEVVHYFDMWHVSKSIKKAITAASKAPGCSALDVWVQAAANHMHWCATASRGNGHPLVEAWASIARHVADIQNGHGGLYATCLHGPQDDVEWLSPGMPAHDKFAGIVALKRLLKDLRQLSPDTQTFSLESFHNVLNGFAPKSTALSSEGMLARVM
ncbi:hypothetical protein HPB47_015831 [Ixodes persulcatus]|uniref:Uncharacterized protein n=1 Tax=Ixodes persulcatus TaxID=34615 RepID=A0AC60R2L2_IXOPE|nr:hypothetical protein HPB47_015831 [Ixodes persulcatus]